MPKLKCYQILLQISVIKNIHITTYYIYIYIWTGQLAVLKIVESNPMLFLYVTQKIRPFLVLENYEFTSYPEHFLSLLISPFHAVSTVKNNSFGALNHLPLSTTALKPGGLSVFCAVHRQVIKISNLIFNSLWIKPLRHSSEVQANGGINKGISGISKQGEVEKKRCILLDRTTWRCCLVMSQQLLLTPSVNFCWQGKREKKLSRFNPASKVSHMQQSNLVYVIPSVPFEPLKKAKILIILMVL